MILAAPSRLWADQVTEFEIGVRSRVIDRPKHGPQKDPGGRHGKVYGILSIGIIKQKEKLARPVDAYRLLGQLKQELAKNGFVEVAKGAKPEILLTVLYGRSWLVNPYMQSAQVQELPTSAGGRTTGGEGGPGGPSKGVGNAGRAMPDEAPTQELSLADWGLMMRLSENGVEAKSQKNEAEKLCIMVFAWEYPKNKGDRPKRLWSTTMVTDDPEHRDLNAISGEMLAAGAALFDREPKEEEASIFRPLPDGHVEIGTPEEVSAVGRK